MWIPNRSTIKVIRPNVVAITQLWSAYVFYHDTFDPERFASLFLPDGIFDQEYNDQGMLVPVSGIGGMGCVLRGRGQIAEFISLETNGATPLSFPGPRSPQGHQSGDQSGRRYRRHGRPLVWPLLQYRHWCYYCKRWWHLFGQIQADPSGWLANRGKSRCLRLSKRTTSVEPFPSANLLAERFGCAVKRGSR